MKRQVQIKDLGVMEYREAWDYQELLVSENVKKKSDRINHIRNPDQVTDRINELRDQYVQQEDLSTINYLLFVEHPEVYTLGKSGNMDHVLLNERQLTERNIQFFHTNRGGDITFHGPGQIVGYPILDLEKFETDIGKYLRNLEETVIRTLEAYGIQGERSPGETGVWIEPGVLQKARKICAMGVRCSRWITMHGFALNVNTDLSYFNHIIPCGISNKQVTSLEKELGRPVDPEEVKELLKKNFKEVFDVDFI